MATAGATALTTGHIGLNVSDLGRSIEFYSGVFGFEVIAESRSPDRGYAFLGTRGQIVLTLWQQSGGRFVTDRPGLHHLSFQVPSIAEVGEVEGRLRVRGATIHHDGVVPHQEGADSGGLYFEDPDGIRLEVFAPSGAGGRAAPHGDVPTCGFF